MAEKSKFAMATYLEPDGKGVKLILEIDDWIKDDPETIDIGELEPLLKGLAGNIKLILYSKDLMPAALHILIDKMLEAAVETNNLIDKESSKFLPSGGDEGDKGDDDDSNGGFPDDAEFN